MKIKQVFFMLIFILTNISANPLAEGEMWIRVSDYLDNLRGGVTITVYDINWQIVDMGITASTTVEQYGNAFIWMDGEPVSTSDSAYAMGPLEYEETYYFVIDNKYAKIHVGEHSQTPDEHLYFKNNTFTLNPTHNTFTLVSQADWNVKTVVVKNSFNAGNVKIDNTLHTNIGTNGLTKIFGEPTFPHTLEAIDNQSYDNYLRKFQSWSKNGSYYASNKTASITAVSATYTANFLNQFNLTFKNSFVGVGNGGTIKVNGITESSPTIEHHVLQFNSITVETVYQVINGIEYLFKEWNDGVTSSSRTITPTDNKNFTASFTGRPYNGYRNLHFNDSDPVGTPIKLFWNEHPNKKVTKYQIWRKHGKSGSYQLIATKYRGTTTYTDYDYSITHNTSTDNLTWYDVRAYYSTEESYAEPDYKAIYGEMLFKHNRGKGDSTYAQISINENNITNFPNPFNPTTQVSYQLKESGHVTIKVYDVLGKEVADLVDEVKPSGKYNVTFNGSDLSSGIYFISMRVNNFYKTQKIILAK